MSHTLLLLQQLFGNKFLLDIKDLSKILGISEITIRNRLAERRFEIPTFLEGSRRFARLDDVAEYIDRISSKEPPKRRGPKTKAEKIAAAKAEVSHA